MSIYRTLSFRTRNFRTIVFTPRGRDPEEDLARTELARLDREIARLERLGSDGLLLKTTLMCRASVAKKLEQRRQRRSADDQLARR
jgi:hypothetical protein